MHVLTSWTAKRSGPRITVIGYDHDDRQLKFSVTNIQGPCRGRMVSPASSIGIMPDGDVIVLA